MDYKIEQIIKANAIITNMSEFIREVANSGNDLYGHTERAQRELLALIDLEESSPKRRHTYYVGETFVIDKVRYRIYKRDWNDYVLVDDTEYNEVLRGKKVIGIDPVKYIECTKPELDKYADGAKLDKGE